MYIKIKPSRQCACYSKEKIHSKINNFEMKPQVSAFCFLSWLAKGLLFAPLLYLTTLWSSPLFLFYSMICFAPLLLYELLCSSSTLRSALLLFYSMFCSAPLVALVVPVYTCTSVTGTLILLCNYCIIVFVTSIKYHHLYNFFFFHFV